VVGADERAFARGDRRTMKRIRQVYLDYSRAQIDLAGAPNGMAPW
jgi:hypothetical protein